jgi:hypothetical protein
LHERSWIWTNSETFELLGGRSKSRREAEIVQTRTTGRRNGNRSREPGTQRDPSSFRINYEELPFEDGSARHSRFLGGVVQLNTLSTDYSQEWKGSDEAKLAYVTLMIGKETVAYNDKTSKSDDYLEKLLSFHFKLKAKITLTGTVLGKRGPGRPRKLM